MDTLEELQLQHLTSIIGLHATQPFPQYFRKCRMAGKVPQMMSCDPMGGVKMSSVFMMNVFCGGIE